LALSVHVLTSQRYIVVPPTTSPRRMIGFDRDPSQTPAAAFPAGFVRSALYAAPMALLFVVLEDHGPAQGRGAETGAAGLLGPVVAMVLLMSAALVAALAGILGGLASWMSRVSGEPLFGYGVAVIGGLLAHHLRGLPGARPWFEVILILMLPAALTVWQLRPRGR